MAISWVGASTQATSTSSPLTANLPAGYDAGDLLVAIITTTEDSPAPSHGISTSGSSWTQIGSTQFLDTGTTGIAQSVWYRVAQSSSETAPSASCPTPNVLAVTIVAFHGVDIATPLDGVAVKQGTNAAAATLQPNGATGITTATNNAWVVSVVSTEDDNALDLSVANGFTDRVGGANYDTTTGSDCSQGLATILKATAGAQTAPTHRQTVNGNDAWAWHLFVLRESPTTSVNAGQAAATGTANNTTVTVSPTPTTATATGTVAGPNFRGLLALTDKAPSYVGASAVVSNAIVNATVNPTTATATGTAYDATVTVGAPATEATASGVISGGSGMRGLLALGSEPGNAATVNVAVAAAQAAATGTGNDATASVSGSNTNVNAEQAAATGTAYDTVVNIAAGAGSGSGSGSANGSTGNLSVSSGQASASGAASDAVGNLGVAAGQAAASGAASDAVGNLSAAAAQASATGTANGPAPTVATTAAQASATGTANDAVGNIAPTASDAAATATAANATANVAVSATQAASTGTGYDASALAVVLANAGQAAATGTANDAVVNVTATPATAEATGQAFDAPQQGTATEIPGGSRTSPGLSFAKPRSATVRAIAAYARGTANDAAPLIGFDQQLVEDDELLLLL